MKIASRATPEGNVYQLRSAATSRYRPVSDQSVLHRDAVVEALWSLVVRAEKGEFSGIFVLANKPDGSGAGTVSGDMSPNFDRLAKKVAAGLRAVEGPMRLSCKPRLVCDAAMGR